MSIEFTRKQYMRVWQGDRLVSSHISLLECAESASADAENNGEGDYQIRIGAEVWYEVSIRFITDRAIDGLTIVQANPPPANNPPVWDSQPVPIFTEGVASNYDLTLISSDPDSDPLTYSLNTGAVSLPTHVTWTPATGILAYNGNTPLAETSGHIATLDDGTDTTDSVAFSIQKGIGFPRLSTGRIGRANFGEDHSTAAAQRAAIALCDLVTLGTFSGFEMDGPTADPGWLTHAEIVDDLKTRNPDLLIWWYFNAMETDFDSGNDYDVKLQSETGPPGAEAHWGAGNNDWWGRAGDGSVPGGGFGNFVNMTDHVTADSNGDYAGEWYADNRIKDFFDQLISEGSTVGPDGSQPYMDNVFIKAHISGVDWNGDGANEDAQDYYDPENATHVATQPLAVISAGKWRQGYRDCFTRILVNYPNAITSGNCDEWSRDTSQTPPISHKVLPEYQDGGDFESFIEGGLGGEQLSNNDLTQWPRSGIKSDGTTHPNAGTFIKAFNSYDYMVRVSKGRKLARADWRVDCSKRATPSNTPDGHPVWDSVPDSGASFAMLRYCLCGTLMTNAYFGLDPIDVGTVTTGHFQSTVHFDEFGTINTGTTGLSKHWLGHPIDETQTGPKYQTVWWREFDNGLAIFNSDTNDANSAVTVPIANLPGGATEWKRITGSQNPSVNTGANQTTDLTIPPINGILLQRR